MGRLIDMAVRLLPAPLRRTLRSPYDAYIQAATGLTHTSRPLETDVFVCGYPKSGNTWFQYLVAAVVFGVNVEFAPDVMVNSLVTDVQDRQYFRRLGPTCYFKTHHLPRPEYRRIVYLMRDGRDAMVSYFHHMNALNSSPVDFLKTVRTGEGLYPGKWHEHVLAYQANPYQAKILTIKYEDLKRDPAVEMRRFCEFVGIERSDAQIQAMVATTAFDKMRSKETKQGWENPKWPKDKPFVRRGVIGSYKDEMPPEVLAAFLADAQQTLIQCGYDVPGSEA